MKETIVTMIKDLVAHEYLYFQTSLLVKLNPHSWPLQIWGVCVSPNDQIFLMDGFETWHELEETDRNYSIVLQSLFQRMQTIHKQFKTVA